MLAEVMGMACRLAVLPLARSARVCLWKPVAQVTTGQDEVKKPWMTCTKKRDLSQAISLLAINMIQQKQMCKAKHAIHLLGVLFPYTSSLLWTKRPLSAAGQQAGSGSYLLVHLRGIQLVYSETPLNQARQKGLIGGVYFESML